MILPGVVVFADDHFLHISSHLLKLVEVLLLLGHTLRETLALTHRQDDFLSLGASDKG